MSQKARILSVLDDEAGGPTVFLPDLTLWYDWHHGRSTMPEEWRGLSLPDVSRAMGLPIWFPVSPWRMESPGLSIESKAEHGERSINWHTSSGTLVSRWKLGADGDWWQVEYPVKTATDLTGVLEIVQARTYVIEAERLGDWEKVVGNNGLVAIEIPRRAYSDLLHQFLGWSDGLMYLREPLIADIVAVLESKLQDLVLQIASFPGAVVLSPDNLDGQFVSPKAFQAHMAESYKRTTETLHSNGKRLVVHVGGPIRRLLQPLSEAGVDVFQGISGPPQSDATMAEARDLVGAEPVLWGGIAQDVLLSPYGEEQFRDTVTQAVNETRGAPRQILGISDKVPVEALVDRLRFIGDTIR